LVDRRVKVRGAPSRDGSGRDGGQRLVSLVRGSAATIGTFRRIRFLPSGLVNSPAHVSVRAGGSREAESRLQGVPP
jgi:hypothetical protein